MRIEEQFFWRSEIVQQGQLRGFFGGDHGVGGRMITAHCKMKLKEELRDDWVSVCVSASSSRSVCPQPSELALRGQLAASTPSSLQRLREAHGERDGAALLWPKWCHARPSGRLSQH